MIYLISQTLLCLALAALFGGTLGWLAHGLRTRSALDATRAELARRTRLLTEAQADVQMLGDDFEDLRIRSREEIDALRADNAELPTLAANLEKSQLMVRQLIQRHDAQVRDLTTRNEELTEQLTILRAQADLRERAHAELEASRLTSSQDDPLSEPLAPPASAPGEVEDADADASPTPRRGWASRPPAETGGELDASSEGGGTLDEVMEVDTELAAELRDDDGTKPHAPAIDAVRASESGEDAFDEEEDEANATLAIDIVPADLEFAFDLDQRDTPLFDPVDHQDDLQRLFGIGPITEKALNTLGITSYSQLAELERHEIEKIADALQIVPERIERDDWVGNARRQLEDVLKQL